MTQASNSSPFHRRLLYMYVKGTEGGLIQLDFCENLYLQSLSYHHLFGLIVILVHKFMTYLTYL